MAGPVSVLDASTFGVLWNTPAALRALLGGQPDEVLDRANEDGWTPKHVLAHLLTIDGAALAGRIRSILAGEQDVANVDEQALLEASGFLDRDVSALLRDFERLRRRNVECVRALEEDDLTRTATHELVGEIAVADILHNIAYHDLLHVRQISEMLIPALDARRGAFEVF
jgi:hypothetical protein